MRFTLQLRDGSMWWSDGDWEDHRYITSHTALSAASLLGICERGYTILCSDRDDGPPRQKIAFNRGDVRRVVEVLP